MAQAQAEADERLEKREQELKAQTARQVEAERAAHRLEAEALASRVAELENELAESRKEAAKTPVAASEDRSSNNQQEDEEKANVSARLNTKQAGVVQQLILKYKRVQREKQVLLKELQRARRAAKAASDVAHHLSAAATAAQSAADDENLELDDTTRALIETRLKAHGSHLTKKKLSQNQMAISSDTIGLVVDTIGVSNALRRLNGGAKVRRDTYGVDFFHNPCQPRHLIF